MQQELCLYDFQHKSRDEVTDFALKRFQQWLEFVDFKILMDLFAFQKPCFDEIDLDRLRKQLRRLGVLELSSPKFICQLVNNK